MFGSTVGFSGSAGRIVLFPVTSNPSWRQAAILDNFEWPYLRNDSFDQLTVYSGDQRRPMGLKARERTLLYFYRAVIFATAQLSCITECQLFHDYTALSQTTML